MLPLKGSQLFAPEVPYVHSLLDLLLEIQRQPQASQSYVQPIERLFSVIEVDHRRV